MKDREPAVGGARDLDRAAEWIRRGARVVAFTGAGISVESGIPPFRGEEGLWRQVDPSFIEIDRFCAEPLDSWRKIREIFYEHFGHARPNAAHEALARLERAGFLHAIVTQNIDYLHQDAGSRSVVEFHGQSKQLRCLSCDRTVPAEAPLLEKLPPRCTCGGLFKPDFVFFGEPIPAKAAESAFALAETADLMLVVGTSGEVMPACQIPLAAAARGVRIIEVNPVPSAFTPRITNLFLQGKAGPVLSSLAGRVLGMSGGDGEPA